MTNGICHRMSIVLVTEADGQIVWPSDKGLYFLDTRVISSALAAGDSKVLAEFTDF